ncbi:protein of unknown function (plasmid) [Azospirillum lipoferum 4B]|uniref:Uncharacterized protein n=1 Tax=Azospirillum lipoferum (strain 4B) TaxID=862719 RepID=G7ZEX2_AZOL4|nr:protein of unknown function [Azospirillum lipoferum 4B]
MGRLPIKNPDRPIRRQYWLEHAPVAACCCRRCGRRRASCCESLSNGRLGWGRHRLRYAIPLNDAMSTRHIKKVGIRCATQRQEVIIQFDCRLASWKLR